MCPLSVPFPPSTRPPPQVQERIPSWTDRIQYHSLADRSGELLPEPFDPDHPDTSPHNYHAVSFCEGVADRSWSSEKSELEGVVTYLLLVMQNKLAEPICGCKVFFF